MSDSTFTSNLTSYRSERGYIQGEARFTIILIITHLALKILLLLSNVQPAPANLTQFTLNSIFILRLD